MRKRKEYRKISEALKEALKGLLEEQEFTFHLAKLTYPAQLKIYPEDIFHKIEYTHMIVLQDPLMPQFELPCSINLQYIKLLILGEESIPIFLSENNMKSGFMCLNLISL